MEEPIMLKKNHFFMVILISVLMFSIASVSLFTADDPQPQPTNKEKKAIEIDSKIFDQYIGEYEVSPEFYIKIFKEDDRFYTQATGQMKFEIKPESETKFFLTVVEATITFIKEDGKVTKLIIHQGGKEFEAKKI